jgi:ATP-dependent protease ClpP protease subunit
MKEILLYSPIFSFTAESMIQQMSDAGDKNITVRVNSPGGSVFAGWGIVAKSMEVEGDFKIKVDGTADSMAAIFLLFHNDVEALNVSKFTLHRASTFSTKPSDLALLAEINKDIRAAFEKKLDIPEFEKIAGVTLDEFFNAEKVIDVNLNAKQAKKIGLISKVNTLKAADFEALSMKFAALSTEEEEEETTNEPEANSENKPKNKKMTLEELKNSHPEVYAQAVKVGVTAEKDRAGAWMEFVDVDAKAVAEGIESDKPLSQKAMAEFSKKMFSAQTLADSEEENTEDAGTEKPKTADEIAAKKEKDFLAEVDSELGIEKTEK